MALNTNIKILVVDDFATMRKIIKNILLQLGFKDILEADDGTTALELLKKQKVDLIISDWNMPKMPGIELLKAVRSNEELKDIKFIMVTAEAQKENVIEAIKYGVNQYVVKPFTPETLKEKLEKVLGD
ncbi:response regulator receiver protein [Thermodesulfobacterium geofontis OPF15]|jgi:two-component system chemotaxis response regulator CheY|uniref:Response regulator receiver protein n=1 Tax=Thermodesulfobacterium geofontis (strain OPF15) TaxID=795359 RepID=F8C2K9_THEGP|nr:chemotaxis response regulator CheY [Thermodesulfobacterium geofontis]AEH23406.1 response regulator receiver protein [Thermodesulfobacterium geofontis OPF15]